MSESKKTGPQLDLYYITDPLSSVSWAFEPVLRKFIYAYGKYIDTLTVVMGGMIEKWDAASGADGNSSRQKAEEMAYNWKQAGLKTRMPIDGSIWLEKPTDSSFPGSKIYEIIGRDHPEKAMPYLRKLRENVMLWNQDISDVDVLRNCLDEMALDSAAILDQADSPEGSLLLNADLQLAETLQVDVIPTVVLVNHESKGLKIKGAQPLEALIDALGQMLSSEVQLVPDEIPPLFKIMEENPFLLSKEIEVLYAIAEEQVSAFVESSLANGGYQKGTILGETYYTLIK